MANAIDPSEQTQAACFSLGCLVPIAPPHMELCYRYSSSPRGFVPANTSFPLPEARLVIPTRRSKSFVQFNSRSKRMHSKRPTSVIGNLSDAFTEPSGKAEGGGELKVKGIVILQKKNLLDFNDFAAGVVDNFSELVGKQVSFQLVSATDINPESGNGNLGEVAFLEDWISIPDRAVSSETSYKITFKWDFSHFGSPGACLVRNLHHNEFFLKSLALEIPGHGNVHFICNSWIYPTSKYETHRVFFSNQSYLPDDTPPALAKLRHDELVNLRGNGQGERKERDRIYDYDVYNDLGNPDKGEDLSRPVLGGSAEFPYPRRGRTGRPLNETDPSTESRLPQVLDFVIYVPRDERFGRVKLSDFLAYSVKFNAEILLPTLESQFDSTPNEFDSFDDILRLYKDGINLPSHSILEAARDLIPLEFIRQIVPTDGKKLLRYPLPQVIAADESSWREDEEFARQMLAGVNPLVIQRLQTFPPRSKLDPKLYGPQISSITAAHLEKNLDGLTVTQALEQNRLFILDYHDALMPYLNRINALASTKTYASRTILFLQSDGTLKPTAIELSLPPSQSDGSPTPVTRARVFTPLQPQNQQSLAVWQLAKAHVSVNDWGYHELISHWLRTHAVTEPFVLATNRQLSVLHPIYKLLNPHFRDTMNINALARQILINADGILERAVFPGKYTVELSSVIYKDWRFDHQGLPADLLKRGMAVVDERSDSGLRLVIEDYPYAVDGLEIWFAIQSWVGEYLSFYYKDDNAVKDDREVQEWWKEIRTVGHADKKDENWWYKMETIAELQQTITTIIWVASALHAATNFGQYAYAGYMPNRPSLSRRLIPDEGSADFSELQRNPDLFFLRTVPNQYQTTLGMALMHILSTHSTDEVYLGQRTTHEWTSDGPILEAFERFTSRLKQIEKNISERNENPKLKNRFGPAKVPYTLLYPSTSDLSGKGGLTGRGIPNSIAI